MVVGAFVSMWRKDDDPDDFGQKMYGSDNAPRVKVIESILNNAGRLIIFRPTMLREKWAENELDKVMKTLMHSGETYHVSILICVVNLRYYPHCQLTYVHPILTLSTDKWRYVVTVINCQ